MMRALVGALDIAQSPALGTDPGVSLGKVTGVSIESDLAKGLAQAEYFIDFTRPEGTASLEYCAEHGIKMIIGTTGFDDAGRRQLPKLLRKQRSCSRQI